jgi:pimeloyl-ACP methyl ester carboxylesterase
MFQMGGVGPMFGQLGFFHKFAGKDFEDKRPRDRYVAESRRLLGVLDQHLAGRAWIMGDDYTIADIAIWPWVRIAAWAGVTEAAVLAHDYGDTVAQELLARQRTGGALRLTGVAFLNGGLFPEAHRARPIQRLLASPLGPLVARLSSQRTFVRSMRAIAGAHPPSDAELDAMWQLASQGGGLQAMPGLLGYLDERRRHRARWVGALIDSPVPLRLVDGLADPVSGAPMAARYRALVPRADVVELPGVGHYPQLEAPAAVLAAVAPFLATCATTAA